MRDWGAALNGFLEFFWGGVERVAAVYGFRESSALPLRGSDAFLLRFHGLRGVPLHPRLHHVVPAGTLNPRSVNRSRI